MYAALAVVFAFSFVLVGVGSGNGGGLSQLYTGIFGGSGGSSVSKAQDEIKKDPAKGYQDLATAYEQKGDLKNATEALKSYLVIKKTDAATWATLAGLEMSQGNTFATQYQNAQQAAQTADPSAPFLPGGILGSAVGQNPTYQGASQDASARTSLLYQKADGRVRGRRHPLPDGVEAPSQEHVVPAAARDGGAERRQHQGHRQRAEALSEGRSERSAEEADREADQGAPAAEHPDGPVGRRRLAGRRLRLRPRG